MTELDDDELCLISLCATEGTGPATVAALRRAARDRSAPLRVVMALSTAQLQAEIGLTPSAARAVASVRNPLATGRSVLEQLADIDARVVLEGQNAYPQWLVRLLGPRAPAVLFVAGSPALLQRPCLAIVGSRRPSRGARSAARFLARAHASSGSTIVSGGARGIDSAAHAAALSAGGTAIVPALGLARFRPHGFDTREVSADKWCVLGQFPPQAGWRSAQALLRNRTIVALSKAVVAFEPRDCGGTWHSSITALRMRKPLFVVSASRRGAKGRGLEQLVRLGAVALDPTRMPDPEALACLIADYRPPPSADQLPLFDPLEQ
ncbi:MAG: DNA-processing protein DprA [Planctomycetota bacterium]|jgi:DNA processing protein